MKNTVESERFEIEVVNPVKAMYMGMLTLSQTTEKNTDEYDKEYFSFLSNNLRSIVHKCEEYQQLIAKLTI